MGLSLDRQRIDKIHPENILEELNVVAKHFGYRRFTGREFDSVSKLCKRSTVTNERDAARGVICHQPSPPKRNVSKAAISVVIPVLFGEARMCAVITSAARITKAAAKVHETKS